MTMPFKQVIPVDEERNTVVELRAQARKRLVAWADENIFAPMRELFERAGLADVRLQVHPFDFYGRGEPLSFNVVSARVVSQPLLNWMDAEQLRQFGVTLEVRVDPRMSGPGGGDWHPVSGKITEHCSDLDFRVALEQPPQFGKYGRIVG